MAFNCSWIHWAKVGFVRYGEEMTATATVDRDADDAIMSMTDLRDLAMTYGWQLA